jgi:hypothetical protein
MLILGYRLVTYLHQIFLCKVSLSEASAGCYSQERSINHNIVVDRPDLILFAGKITLTIRVTPSISLKQLVSHRQ